MSNLASIIDRLGVLKAQMAELAIEEKALKGAIIDHGPGAHEGNIFRATVSISERETLDMEAVRGQLSRQFIAAHTSVTDVTTVRVVARTGKLKAA